MTQNFFNKVNVLIRNSLLFFIGVQFHFYYYSHNLWINKLLLQTLIIIYFLSQNQSVHFHRKFLIRHNEVIGCTHEVLILWNAIFCFVSLSLLSLILIFQIIYCSHLQLIFLCVYLVLALLAYSIFFSIYLYPFSYLPTPVRGQNYITTKSSGTHSSRCRPRFHMCS